MELSEILKVPHNKKSNWQNEVGADRVGENLPQISIWQVINVQNIIKVQSIKHQKVANQWKENWTDQIDIKE